MTKHTRQAPETPFERFKQTYTPLYRTLLVLGSIAVLISLTGLTNLRTTLGFFESDPIYATSGLISALIVPAFMIASLILLWHKHPAGIRLRLAGYAVSITASVVGLFTTAATLERITRETLEATIRNGGSGMSQELTASITESAFYGSLYLSIAINILFAWLWWKAWKKQLSVDAKKKEKTSK